MKRKCMAFCFVLLMTCALLARRPFVSYAGEDALSLSTPSCVLMEITTGKIIYDKNMDEVLRPASITKIMTLLLIFEALAHESIHLEDLVTVSEHAASMGGSQVFLEPGEQMDVDTMIKCIAISSANDASVAMAEFIAGSEPAFVERMNQRAKELGMERTNFVNCCGLDTDGHVSTAYDVALMSRALVGNFPEISRYATIWMDTITHHTQRGTSEFGLTNTNKLIKQYNGITGLKTGSTDLAKYCLSATAERKGISFVAVIMAAPDTKTRFSEAMKLLNYGFSVCSMYIDEQKEDIMQPVPVQLGILPTVPVLPEKPFRYLMDNTMDSNLITKQIQFAESVKAPVTAGTPLGKITYYYQDEVIGEIQLIAEKDVSKRSYADCIKQLIHFFYHYQVGDNNNHVETTASDTNLAAL